MWCPINWWHFRGSILDEDVLISSGSSVSENSVLTKSVIGSNVKIGKNVSISGSFIFSNTVVGDGCIINHSVLGKGCLLQPKCTIKSGCILGSGVEVPEGSVIEDSLVKATIPEECKCKRTSKMLTIAVRYAKYAVNCIQQKVKTFYSL